MEAETDKIQEALDEFDGDYDEEEASSDAH